MLNAYFLCAPEVPIPVKMRLKAARVHPEVLAEPRISRQVAGNAFSVIKYAKYVPKKGAIMVWEIGLGVAALGIWVVLNRWILPKLGVPT